MTVALAATWNPRGELTRLLRLMPLFSETYAGVVVCFPPVANPQSMLDARQSIQEAGLPECFSWIWVESPVWSWGRYLAMKTALGEIPASHVQYADMDRLLRWMETRPQEWLLALEKIQGCDCLVIGRTQAAYASHPKSLVQTEAISNRVISGLAGREMDVSAGSKGFSRVAAEMILANSSPGRALGTDGEWPVLAHRLGCPIEYIEVDGLDWESADRYLDQAAGVDLQRQLAQAVDADPLNWERRVGVAAEIVQCGLEAAKKELIR